MRPVLGYLAIAIMVFWLSQVGRTTSVVIGIVLPILGTVLAFAWFIWTAQERIASRSHQQVDLAQLESLKQVMRDQKPAASKPGSRA